MDNMNIGQIALVSLGIISASVVLVLADKKRRSPEKSYKNHAMNMMLVIPRALGLGFFKKPLTLENAFKYATRKTGLSDFGDSGFSECYQMVLQTATQKKQQYTNLGFISARIELNMTFVRRLKMIEYLKQVPRVLSIGVPYEAKDVGPRSDLLCYCNQEGSPSLTRGLGKNSQPVLYPLLPKKRLPEANPSISVELLNNNQTRCKVQGY